MIVREKTYRGRGISHGWMRRVSRWDFPSSLREKSSLTNCWYVKVVNNGGEWGVRKDGIGLISFSKLGLLKVAMDSLSLFAFTVAQCSMLLYSPFVIICQNQNQQTSVHVYLNLNIISNSFELVFSIMVELCLSQQIGHKKFLVFLTDKTKIDFPCIWYRSFEPVFTMKFSDLF